MAKVIPSPPTPGAVVATPAAGAALPAVVTKKAGTVNGTPALVVNTLKELVAREVKALKECSPTTADVVTLAEVVAVPAPVAKAPGPFHLTSVVVEILGMEMGDRGCSCEEHASNCGEVMAKDVVVRLWKVQIQVEGKEETAIAANRVIDGINCCHVGFLPCHMVRHVTRYDGALAQVIHVLTRI